MCCIYTQRLAGGCRLCAQFERAGYESRACDVLGIAPHCTIVSVDMCACQELGKHGMIYQEKANMQNRAA